MKREQDRRVETDREKIFGPDRDVWYWCMHCERAYRADEFRIDEFGLQMCPYEDCDGSTVLDAWPWSRLVEINGYPLVPVKGVEYPMYPSREDLVRLGLRKGVGNG